jgi:hypothetical protein
VKDLLLSVMNAIQSMDCMNAWILNGVQGAALKQVSL